MPRMGVIGVEVLLPFDTRGIGMRWKWTDFHARFEIRLLLGVRGRRRIYAWLKWNFPLDPAIAEAKPGAGKEDLVNILATPCIETDSLEVSRD